MPNLGCVAADPSIGCEIDRVENRQLFTEIFPVRLVLDYDEPAFFLLVATAPEEDGHERASSKCSVKPASPQWCTLGGYACHGIAIDLIPRGARSEERRVGKECRSRWSTYR